MFVSERFSWGSDKDHCGKIIDENATDVWLPHSANDADIALVAQRCKQVRSLNFSQCVKITDTGLQHLRDLPLLQTLDLYGCVQISDEGLQHLSAVKHLQTLNLGWCTQLTDAGLAHLSGLWLLQLGTDCTAFSDAGLAAFRSAQSKKLSGCNQSSCEATSEEVADAPTTQPSSSAQEVAQLRAELAALKQQHEVEKQQLLQEVARLQNELVKARDKKD